MWKYLIWSMCDHKLSICKWKQKQGQVRGCNVTRFWLDGDNHPKFVSYIHPATLATGTDKYKQTVCYLRINASGMVRIRLAGFAFDSTKTGIAILTNNTNTCLQNWLHFHVTACKECVVLLTSFIVYGTLLLAICDVLQNHLQAILLCLICVHLAIIPKNTGTSVIQVKLSTDM